MQALLQNPVFLSTEIFKKCLSFLLPHIVFLAAFRAMVCEAPWTFQS